jgi:hypothetical protein
MRTRLLLSAGAALLVILGLGGCSDDHHTNPVLPPAAPRGLFSVTGDREVTLWWYSNTEPDVVTYRVFDGSCPSGDDCPYTLIAEVPALQQEYMSCVVTGLANGVTRFYAVAAVNRAGAESPLTYNDVFDTPRPAGRGLVLSNFLVPEATGFGYDFSAFQRTSTTDVPTDIFFGYYEDTTGYIHQQVFVPDYGTNIQDAGYASSLDAVDYAPVDENGVPTGWSPTGTVEATAGHNYVVWTRDDHFAKFRVISVSPTHVMVDWAYQLAPGNVELRARPAAGEGPSGRRPLMWLRR